MIFNSSTHYCYITMKSGDSDCEGYVEGIYIGGENKSVSLFEANDFSVDSLTLTLHSYVSLSLALHEMQDMVSHLIKLSDSNFII